jgi:hypothetical protein
VLACTAQEGIELAVQYPADYATDEALAGASAEPATPGSGNTVH